MGEGETQFTVKKQISDTSSALDRSKCYEEGKKKRQEKNRGSNSECGKR